MSEEKITYFIRFHDLACMPIHHPANVPALTFQQLAAGIMTKMLPRLIPDPAPRPVAHMLIDELKKHGFVGGGQMRYLEGADLAPSNMLVYDLETTLEVWKNTTKPTPVKKEEAKVEETPRYSRHDDARRAANQREWEAYERRYTGGERRSSGEGEIKNIKDFFNQSRGPW